MNVTSSPDSHAQGLLSDEPDALRYDGHINDPREVAGILQSFMPNGARVLDVGCGTGSVTAIANMGKGNDVFGIEPDAARAKVARSRGIEVFEGFFTDEYLISHDKFDVIMFADVLEHVANPAGLLQIATRGLRPNGALLVSVPNVAHWSVRFDLLFGHFDYSAVGIRDATHLRWFTAKTIRELLQHEGFDVITCKQTAGVELPEYQSRRPWIWMPGRLRRGSIRALSVGMPNLFGCQHVLMARMKAKALR